MRRFLVIASVLIACFASLGSTWVLSGKGSHASALANFSDDFSGSLSNWTTDAGSWSIISSFLAQLSGSFTVDKIHYNTACGTNNQYAKFSLTSAGGGWTGPRFRVTGTTGYMTEFRVSNDDAIWLDTNGTEIQAGTLTGIVDGSVIGVTIEGSGNSTVLRIWLNPTGLPTSTSNWNGDSTPDLSFTNNPAVATDSGSFIGFNGRSAGGEGEFVDDFFGGDCP